MAEDPVETTIMDGYNCVSIKGRYKKFANFVYKVESHAIDVETKSKKYLLECTTIADAQTFTIILARDDLKSYLKLKFPDTDLRRLLIFSRCQKK